MYEVVFQLCELCMDTIDQRHEPIEEQSRSQSVLVYDIIEFKELLSSLVFVYVSVNNPCVDDVLRLHIDTVR